MLVKVSDLVQGSHYVISGEVTLRDSRQSGTAGVINDRGPSRAEQAVLADPRFCEIYGGIQATRVVYLKEAHKVTIRGINDWSNCWEVCTSPFWSHVSDSAGDGRV